MTGLFLIGLIRWRCERMLVYSASSIAFTTGYSNELFELISHDSFHHRISCLNLEFYRHHLDVWKFTTVQFVKHFLIRTTTLCKKLSVDLFPSRYDLRAFNKRAYSYLKCFNSSAWLLLLQISMGSGDYFPPGKTLARLPLLLIRAGDHLQ